MDLYNRCEHARNVRRRMDDLINNIPENEKQYCHITLSFSEFRLMKEHLGWNTGLFKPWPVYRGVRIFSYGLAK